MRNIRGNFWGLGNSIGWHLVQKAAGEQEKREQASLDGHSLHTAFTLAFDIRYQQVMVLISQYPHLVTLRPLYV